MIRRSIKTLSFAIIGSLVLLTVQPKPVQAGLVGKVITKIVFTATKTAIDKSKDKKMLPIVAGFKKGKNPLPKSVTPASTFKNILETLKNDIGLK